MPVSLTEEQLDTAVGKIQLFRAGAGAPIVYLHSAAGETTHGALEELADDHEILVPVFPGFGNSEGIDEIDDIEDAAFHLLDVWERLGLEAPAVVGLSLGGWLAMELATRWPATVGRLVLVNPVGIHLEGNPIKELFGREPQELAEDMFADQDTPMAQMMRSLGEWTGDAGQQTEVPIDLVLPLYKTLSATAKIGWDPYLHDPKLRRRLHRIDVPTLVVRGDRDTFVPPEYAQTFAAELPDARLEVVEGAAHLLPMERPEELARLVRAFLA